MPRPDRHMMTRFFRREEGLGLIEFAFTLPLLLILFAGVIELTRYVLAHQKIDKSATSLADFMGQQEDPEDFNINTLDAAFDKLVDPFDASTAGYIVTGVGVNTRGTDSTADDGLEVLWQRSRGSIGPSRVAASMAGTQLSGIQLTVGEVAIVAEVFYRHSSILDNVGSISDALEFDGENLYKQAVALQRVPPTPPGGTAQPMTNLYGCCGEFCDEGDPTDPNDTDWLPACACVGAITPCRPAVMTPRDLLLENHYGCTFRTCTPDPDAEPVVPFCDRPGNENTCWCNAALCTSGGV